MVSSENDIHRKLFDEKVLEVEGRKGKNSRILTSQHYNHAVHRLKQLENQTEQKTLTDSNLLRRFSLLKYEDNENVVEKLVKPGTNVLYVPMEELFDVIHVVHIKLGHPGRDIMQKHMVTRYYNVTLEHINIYKSFCEKCNIKKSQAAAKVCGKDKTTLDGYELVDKEVLIIVCINLNPLKAAKLTFFSEL